MCHSPSSYTPRRWFLPWTPGPPKTWIRRHLHHLWYDPFWLCWCFFHLVAPQSSCDRAPIGKEPLKNATCDGNCPEIPSGAKINGSNILNQGSTRPLHFDSESPSYHGGMMVSSRQKSAKSMGFRNWSTFMVGFPYLFGCVLDDNSCLWFYPPAHWQWIFSLG